MTTGCSVRSVACLKRRVGPTSLSVQASSTSCSCSTSGAPEALSSWYLRVRGLAAANGSLSSAQPHGTRIYNTLINFLRKEYRWVRWPALHFIVVGLVVVPDRDRGYQEVRSPLMYNKKLWQMSGESLVGSRFLSQFLPIY